MSKEIKDARAYVELHREEIDTFECVIPEKVRIIDWGPKHRGQGRRSGGMILGSMSAAPVGIKKYYSIDNSKYVADVKAGPSPIMDGHQTMRYYKAREFGCSHIQACVYAVTYGK